MAKEIGESIADNEDFRLCECTLSTILLRFGSLLWVKDERIFTSQAVSLWPVHQ